MNSEVINVLKEEACASIRYRTGKEITDENPDINEYMDEIVGDKRVQYVFTWQKEDGYLGDSFHAGWIPSMKLKYYDTGAEAALRFMAEMGIPVSYPVVEKGLEALLPDDWHHHKWKWATEYQPEIGLFGMNHARAFIFSRYGIEDYEFIKTETMRAFECFKRILMIKSIDDITGTYRDKLYFKEGIVLPDSYYLKLLAFSNSWKTEENTSVIAEAISRFIEFSPLPHIYIKAGSQLIAPAQITPSDLKQSPHELNEKEWFWWIHTMELFARMGIIKQVPVLRKQVEELGEILESGDGFFPLKPHNGSFERWGAYTGLALEDSWKNNRWRYDMTFRSLLILKYTGLL